MDELPRDVIEARLCLDEQLDDLLTSGDYQTVLHTVELLRGDLALFARHARRLAAANGDPVPPKRPPKPLSEAARQGLSQLLATAGALKERRLRHDTAGENVAFLSDHVHRRRNDASGWA